MVTQDCATPEVALARPVWNEPVRSAQMLQAERAQVSEGRERLMPSSSCAAACAGYSFCTANATRFGPSGSPAIAGCSSHLLATDRFQYLRSHNPRGNTSMTEYSAARVVSRRRPTGTSPVARICCEDTSYAYPLLQTGAVQRIQGTFPGWTYDFESRNSANVESIVSECSARISTSTS